jgi:hypothetical protein
MVTGSSLVKAEVGQILTPPAAYAKWSLDEKNRAHARLKLPALEEQLFYRLA